MAKKTKCPNCLEEILEGATICKHCGSRLTSKKYLQDSSLVLSLLVALISVSTVAIPAIKNAVIGDRPRISGAVIVSNQHEVESLVTNTGTRDAAIYEIHVSYFRGNQQVQVFLAGNYKNKMLIPGISQRYRMTSEVVVPQLDPGGFSNGGSEGTGMPECNLLIKYIRHDGIRDEAQIPYKCIIV